MTRPAKNIPASVRQRLQDHARKANHPFQEVLEYYAMERFLFRLASSPASDRFVLKGALMFVAWGAHGFRPTRDIDLLARMPNDAEAIASVVREACLIGVPEDGMAFDPASVRAGVIKEGADYEGVRVTFRASLQNARVAMQIDVGFGDVVTPRPVDTVYPTILSFSPPQLAGYTRETAIAEKFEAMVHLGLLNSRMKDFFDVWLLSSQFAFDGATLAAAVGRTFANRKTAVEAGSLALTAGFSGDPAKQTQWAGFLRKLRTTEAPTRLGEVTGAIAEFLLPVVESIRDGRPFDRIWQPGGPWIPSGD